jgi:prevent-host-death family protein
MKYVSSREFRLQPSAIWQILQQGEDIVVTSHGKPFGVLIGTDESKVHELLNEVVKLRARLAVSNMRQQARARGLDKLSQAEINRLVEESR